MSNYLRNKKELIDDYLKNPFKFWKFCKGLRHFLVELFEGQDEITGLKKKLAVLEVGVKELENPFGYHVSKINDLRNKQESTSKEVETLKKEFIELKHALTEIRKETAAKESEKAVRNVAKIFSQELKEAFQSEVEEKKENACNCKK